MQDAASLQYGWQQYPGTGEPYEYCGDADWIIEVPDYDYDFINIIGYHFETWTITGFIPESWGDAVAAAANGSSTKWANLVTV